MTLILENILYNEVLTMTYWHIYELFYLILMKSFHQVNFSLPNTKQV